MKSLSMRAWTFVGLSVITLWSTGNAVEITLSAPQNIFEGEKATVEITLSEPQSSAFTVQYANFRTWEYGYPAEYPEDDFEEFRETHTFAPGETSFSFEITTFPDEIAEPTEVIGVFARDDSAQRFSPANQTAVFILDDDGVMANDALVEGLIGSNLTSIADSGERLVAVGSDGLIVSSSDGGEWIDHRQSGGPDFVSIQYADGEFIALAEDSFALSTNGTTWTLEDIGAEPETDSGWIDAVSVDGRRLFLAEDGTIAIFDSGTWTTSSSLVTDDSMFVGLTWNGSEFAAGGSDQGNRVIAFSEDASDWTLNDPGFDLRKFEWVGDRYLGSNGSRLHQSSDGRNWEVFDSVFTFSGAVFSGNDDVNVVQRNQTVTILDLDSRETTTFDFERNNRRFNDLVMRDSLAIAVANNGLIDVYDLDSQTSTSANVGPTQRFWGCTYGGGRYVTVGDHGTILVTEDPTSWSTVDSPSETRLFDVIWDGSQYLVAGAHGTILTSPDAETWTTQEIDTNYWLRSIATNGSLYGAVGYGGTLVVSENGQDWERRPQDDELRFRDIHWTGSDWLVVGEDEVAFRVNADLTNWSSFSGPSDGGDLTYESILFQGGAYHVATNAGYYYSDNGTTWSLRSETPVTDVHADSTGDILFAEVLEDMTNYAVTSSPEAVVTCGTFGRILYQLKSSPLPVFTPLREIVANESEEFAFIPIQLSDPYPTDLTLRYRAFVAFDYVDWGQLPTMPSPGEVQEEGSFTIPAGATTFTIELPVTDDALVEVTENFTVGLFGSPAGTHFQENVTLVNVALQSEERVVTAVSDEVSECEDLVEATVNRFSLPRFLQVEAVGDDSIVVSRVGVSGFSRDYFLTDDEGNDLTPLDSIRGTASVVWTGDFYLTAGFRNDFHRFTDANNFVTRTLPYSAGSSVWNGSEFLNFSSRGVQRSSDGQSISVTTYTVDGNSLSSFFTGQVHWSERLGTYFSLGTEATSPNGVNWSSATFGDDERKTAMFENGTHLYTFTETAIYESRNGSNWENITPELAEAEGFTIYGGGTDGSVIAFAGSQGTVLYREGDTWRERYFGTDDALRAISYSEPFGWHVGTRSPDRGVFSAESLTSAIASETPHLNDVIWTGNQFIACGETGTILSSDDGEDWDPVESGVDWNLRSLAYNGDTVIAVGNGAGESNNAGVLRSLDGGATWNPVDSLPSAAWLYAAFWTGEHFLIGGAKGVIHYSTDGLSWQSAQSANTVRVYDFASNPAGTMVAVGSSGIALRSLDGGLSWDLTEEGVPPTNVYGGVRENRMHAVIWTGNEFLAAGRQYPDAGEFITDGSAMPTGNLLRSFDGETWTRHHSFARYTFFDLLQLPGRLLAPSQFGRIYTSNFNTSVLWTDARTVPRNGAEMHAAATDGDVVVIVGEVSRINLQACTSISGFGSWASDFGLTGPSAAADAVNNPYEIPNGLAYAWGIDPNEGDARFQDPITLNQISDEEREIVLQEPNTALNSVSYFLEYSEDLRNWRTLSSRTEGDDWFNSTIREGGVRTITFIERFRDMTRLAYRIKVEF